MALPTGGYSFTPREVNLGASPLSALKPINVGEGLSVSFTAMPKYEVPSAKEELVSMGAAKAFETIGTEAANAVKAKEAQRIANQEKTDERTFQATQKGLDRGNALEIAKQRGYKTDAELSTESLRNEVLRKRLEADKEDTINYGTFDLPTRTQKVEDNAPSLWDLGAVDNNTAYSTQPSTELLNSLLNIPPSQLMASAGGAGQAQLQGINAVDSGSIVPPVQQVSTDTMPVQAGVSPEPQYGAMAKYRGIYSPKETKAIRDEFYNKFGESPSGVSVQFDKPLANAPKIIPKATAIQQQEQPQDALGRYMQTWADPSIAAKAADKVAEIMGSEFEYPEVEQIKTKRGEVGYKVKYPKKKTTKLIAEEKAAGLAPEMSKEQNAILLSQIGKLEADKTYSKALESRDSRDIIFTSLDKENGFSDIAAINAFQRLIDPGVAVREGDVALIQSAQAFFSKYNPNFIQKKFESGDKLPSDDREKMRVLTKELARMQMEKANKGPIEKFRSLTKKTGIDPDLLAIPFEIEEPKAKTNLESVRSKMINITKQLRAETDPAKKQQLQKQYDDLKASFQTQQ